MTKIILLFFSLIYFTSNAQKNIIVKSDTSNLIHLIEKYKSSQKTLKINTYRIQLSSNENPENIRWLKNKYLTSFPNEYVEEVFEPPYFKAITGAYIDKKKAEKKLFKIKKDFKSAFIFKQEILMEKYLKNNKSN